MADFKQSAVVTEKDKQYHVNTSRAHRGSFESPADAQLWAITLANREADIQAAVLLSGTVIMDEV